MGLTRVLPKQRAQPLPLTSAGCRPSTSPASPQGRATNRVNVGGQGGWRDPRPATTPVDHLPWAYLPIRNGPQGSFPRSGDALVEPAAGEAQERFHAACLDVVGVGLANGIHVDVTCADE